MKHFICHCQTAGGVITEAISGESLPSHVAGLRYRMFRSFPFPGYGFLHEMFSSITHCRTHWFSRRKTHPWSRQVWDEPDRPSVSLMLRLYLNNQAGCPQWRIGCVVRLFKRMIRHMEKREWISAQRTVVSPTTEMLHAGTWDQAFVSYLKTHSIKCR